MVKRKAEAQASRHNGKGILRKRSKTALSNEDAQKCFRDGLFKKSVLQKYTTNYTKSEPYQHSVINELINDELLRSVRNEIWENVHFTPKETDIYKIHQSGDLANLDGLDDAALEKLPSLLKLRDALYSEPFRNYVATVTASGDLSGRKTDMAINVYTPGCHLLCHDDVIGSRRVSYILYLTDPDIPWKAEWGGALRLFPTSTIEEDGETTKIPSPDVSKIIPPAWNQLSFFAVQPGESFHDVEEVYHAATKEQLEKDGRRVRMAISGWYHIPQIGEQGYVKGAEEKWGHNSSLMQLQGNPDRYDLPQSQLNVVEAQVEANEEKGLDESDLDFLLQYMSPTYLTPDTLEEVSERFLELSSVSLDGLLSAKFSEKVKAYIESQEKLPIPEQNADVRAPWHMSKPPHKHRFLFQQPLTPKGETPAGVDPITELLNVFFPSKQFRKWLEIATECEVENFDMLARRFRKGHDYALATSHEGQSRLELSLGLTPTNGWGGDEEGETEETEELEEEESKSRIKKKANGHSNKKEKREPEVIKKEKEETDDAGGQEVYMAGDDDETGDAAVYKATADEDDGVLFSMFAAWNKMSIVLRDSGVLKFVKYVSKNANGDRWDISAAFGVKETDDDDDDDDDEADGDEESTVPLEDSEEEVFNGFPDSDKSNSD